MQKGDGNGVADGHTELMVWQLLVGDSSTLTLEIGCRKVKMKGRSNLYIEETMQKTKRHFDLNDKPLKLPNVPYNYDSKQTCQSKHNSPELV